MFSSNEILLWISDVPPLFYEILTFFFGTRGLGHPKEIAMMLSYVKPLLLLGFGVYWKAWNGFYFHNNQHKLNMLIG